MAAYDLIDFSPPAGVRSACARGIKLHEEGLSGDGLQPETVAWARRFAAGDEASPEKARKMAAWFARHGASPEENRARREDKTSPAWVAWLLWGGNPGRSWSARLTRQMNARDRALRAGRAVQGASVKLAAVGGTGAESPWNVLAYATKLKGRGTGVELTSADFTSCVANFTAWGREIPVVLYHADTDATAHPDARKAHAWIVEMRVGTMMRAGKAVATLEARFRWVNDETRTSVETGQLAFGSITIVQGGVDEETGAECGSFLWSFSLTNNPALVDLPRIAASRTLAAGAWYGDIDDRDDVMEMLRAVFGLPALADEATINGELAKLAAMVAASGGGEGSDEASGIDLDDIVGALRSALRLPALTSATDVIAAVRAALAPPPSAPGEMLDGLNDSADSRSMSRGSRAAKETRMSTTMMALAARLGYAAPTEEAAAQHVAARAEESAEVRRSLGLPLASDVQTVAAKITALHADAAKVAVLSAENEALKSVETERHTREVAEHVEALCADPVMAKSRAALESFARNDFAAFSKAYPKPAVNAATLALTSRVTGLGGEKTPAVVNGKPASHSDRAHTLALDLQAKNQGMTYRKALEQASAQIMAEVQS
jgi:hypothetical protein